VLVRPRLKELVCNPFVVIAASECDTAKPRDVPLPLPNRCPPTMLLAPEDRLDPMEAVALPFAPYEPVATSLPVVDPFTPPRLNEKLLAPFGVPIATDTPIEWPATWPVPEPETEPPTFEFAVALSEPLVAVDVPSAPNEAVPPLLLAWPVETETAPTAWPVETEKE